MNIPWNRAEANTVDLLLLVVAEMMLNDIRWSADSSKPSLPRVYKSGVTVFMYTVKTFGLLQPCFGHISVACLLCA